ncbi:hypothetical protein DENSPDRAFT_747217, partial [Dentipellis sp. KUC8613]
RPEEVLWWNKRAKPIPTLPPIAKPDAYMVSWSTWWTSLQPAYRMNVGSSPLVRMEKDDEWDHLVVSGNNGIYIIVISLSW